MKLKYRIAVIGLVPAALASAVWAGATPVASARESVAAAATTGDVAAASRKLMKCGDGKAAYNRCAATRRALIREGYRVSALHHDVPDCTSPGCIPGWSFYYYT